MVVIYDLEKTYIISDLKELKSNLIEVYGDKFGKEAFEKVKKAPVNTTYRANGGPLIKVVTDEQAEKIREKEIKIGMI